MPGFPSSGFRSTNFFVHFPDERTDVLRHFLGDDTTPQNVLFVDLHHHRHFLEVVSVIVDFFREADRRGS